MDKDMTLEEFMAWLATQPNKRQREGQFAFNMLSRVRPDLASKIENTPNDPFMRDDLLPEFWRKVGELW